MVMMCKRFPFIKISVSTWMLITLLIMVNWVKILANKMAVNVQKITPPKGWEAIPLFHQGAMKDPVEIH